MDTFAISKKNPIPLSVGHAHFTVYQYKPVNIEEIIKRISPQWAAKRAYFRNISGLYEAAIPNRTRRTRHVDSGDANFSTQFANQRLVSMARELCQNYDIARGALDIFASKIVGKCLQTQPMVRDTTGHLHPINQEIKKWFSLWINTPEISGISGGKLQRLAVKTWIRDGEFFTHFFEGNDYPHRGVVPFSVEIIETDQIPYVSQATEDSENEIVHGIEFNRYHQPIAYHLEAVRNRHVEKQIIPATEIAHTKLTERFGQVRGVTAFASVFVRLDDLRDYDDSERIAARMAAAVGAQLVKDKDVPYDPNIGNYEPGERQFNFKPGTFFDELLPGERLEIVSSPRPNQQLEAFRAGQLRMASRGLGIPASSFSAEYEGSYSARRQEMVDFYLQLEMIADEFIWQFWHPIYERFIKTLVLYSFIQVPKDAESTTLTNAVHAIPSQPWIDPLKEAAAREILLKLGLNSRSSMIRESGRIPEEVDIEIAADREREEQLGLNFGVVPSPVSEPPVNDEEI